MPLYDRPFYKQLPKNDLGIDTHQGGVVIPKSLLPYLPPLPPPTKGPTEEYFLTLDLFDGSRPVATVTSRWHYQTWGQQRTPEHRLTKNIESALLADANIDDILQFERQLDAVDRYRVTLIRSGTARHGAIVRSNPGRRWGAIEDVFPASLTPLSREMDDIRKLSAEPFSLFRDRPIGEPHRRLLRDAAFARLVKRAYGHLCAACGEGWLVPVGEPGLDPTSEPEAAHIVPVSLHGADDLRNALCLCRAHHWAFDRQVLYVDEGLRWRVISASVKENRNQLLNDIDNTELRPPRAEYPAPAEEALAWHRERVLSA
jgi:putative restriction endonuclease